MPAGWRYVIRKAPLSGVAPATSTWDTPGWQSHPSSCRPASQKPTHLCPCGSCHLQTQAHRVDTMTSGLRAGPDVGADRPPSAAMPAAYHGLSRGTEAAASTQKQAMQPAAGACGKRARTANMQPGLLTAAPPLVAVPAATARAVATQPMQPSNRSHDAQLPGGRRPWSMCVCGGTASQSAPALTSWQDKSRGMSQPRGLKGTCWCRSKPWFGRWFDRTCMQGLNNTLCRTQRV